MTPDRDPTTALRRTGWARWVSRRPWAALGAVGLVAATLAGSVVAARSVAEAQQATPLTVLRPISPVNSRARVVRTTRKVRPLRKTHKRAVVTSRRSVRKPVAPILALPVTGKAMFGISDTLVPYLSSAAQLQHLAAIARTGARWVRVDFSWAAIQSQGPTRFNWAPWDAVVRAATARGLHVLGVVAYTPQWALPTSVNLATPGSYLNPPAHPQAYGTFAGQLAARYGRRGVHAWEIWNEPNVRAFFRPQPNPATYTAMLKSAYVSIKHNDPGATVVSGGIAPCNSTNGIIATRWLQDLYAAGARGYFNAVGDHPYTFSLGGGTAAVSMVWNVDPTSPVILRSIMVAHGDSAKRIWGTEFGAPSVDPALPALNEAVQANMIVQAYTRWSTYAWVGPLMTYTLQDPASPDPANYGDWFGLLRSNGSPKPAFVGFEKVIAQTR
jgi:hypothetical protein